MQVFIDGQDYQPMGVSRSRTASIRVKIMEDKLINALSQPEINKDSKFVFPCKWNGTYSKDNKPVFLYEPAEGTFVAPSTIIAKLNKLIQDKVNLGGAVALASYSTRREQYEKDGRRMMNLVIFNFYFIPISK